MLCGCESLYDKHNLTVALTPWGNSYYSYSNMATQTAMIRNNLATRQQQYVHSNMKSGNKVDQLILKKLTFVNLLLEHSGFYNLEKFEECSTRLGEDSFRNELLFEFDEDSEKGFLEVLFDVPNQKLTDELSLITDNTLFCCNLQVKLKDFLAKYPKTNEYKDFNNILKNKNIINFTLEQLSESSDGNWGVLLNSIPGKEGYEFEFSISIPDTNDTLFPAICERIINHKLGELVADNPNKLLVTGFFETLQPLVLRKNGYIVIYSSEQAIENIVKNVKPGEYSKTLQELNVPKKVVGNGFVYWKPTFFYWALDEISPSPNLLLQGQNFECLNIIRNQNRSFLITQYANIDLNDLHANSIIGVLSSGLEKMINPEIKAIIEVQKSADKLEKCKKELQELYKNKILPFMSTNNGKLPEQEQLGDTFSNDKWCYIKLEVKGDDKTIPLIFDRQSNHGNKINVLFRDGNIVTFEIDNVSSAKKVVSYLHSIYRYDAHLFAELLKAVK
jgi:hypothetical protein